MPSMPLRKRITVLGSVAVLAGALAAGSSVGLAARSDSFSPIQHAVTKSSKATSEKLSFTLTISSSDKALPTGEFMIGGTGMIDNRHKTAQVTVDLGALASALGGVAGGTVPQKIDVRLVKNTVYAYIPAVAKTVTAGKTWLKLDATSVSSNTNVNPKQLQTQLNPTKALASLNKAARVKKLGSTKVKGSPATHYQIQVDAAHAVASLPKDQRAQALKSIQQSGLKTLPLDVYVGKSGYLRRIETKLAGLKTGQGSSPVTLKATLDLFDYGAKVAVHAPPAAKVADAGKLLAKALSGLTG
jgi:hypothetical protein